MARPNRRLVDALRTTADRIGSGARYRWTHMGACNCGHLAQTITDLTPAEIHEMALERAGDWTEQAIDHCPTSGLTIDHVIDQMLELGLSRSDIRDLEKLTGRAVLSRLPAGTDLNHRHRDDVVLYMRTWADLLETQLEDAALVARLAAQGRVRAPEAAASASDA